jgi:phosphohistidine phosphatase
MRFDLVLASTAARVRETIDGVQEHYAFGAPIRFEPRLYGASAEMLLSLVHELPDTVEASLLVGHNPGLQRLLVDLTRDDEKGLRRRVAEKYPTAALATLELPAKHWSDVTPESGKIVELILPQELD